MTKNELIEAVARKAHLTKRAARESIETFLTEIGRALVKGEKVILTGFGTFAVAQRAKRKMFLRGKEEEITPYRAPKFQPGKALKRLIRK